MDTGVVISLGSLLVAALALLFNGRKGTRDEAANQAILSTKLDNINNGITDIRVEMRSMRNDIGSLETRMVRVEERSKSNSHRIDKLEGGTNHED